MVPYTLPAVFDSNAFYAWQKAYDFVGMLPNYAPDGSIVRCHELARGLQPLLGSEWEVVDGHHFTTEHSWLFRAQGEVILDVYAVGRLPSVQLVDSGYLPYRQYAEAAKPYLTHSVAYLMGPTRSDINATVVAWITDFLTPKPKTKCPTCRCHIKFGTNCSCCLSTDICDSEPFI